MPVLMALAILLTYSCSTPIMMPWVQQWRSDAFSPALECQLILQKNWQILLTGCRHNTTQKHHTKITSASLLRINLPKKHVGRKPQPIYHLTMPIKQTIFVCCPDAKRSSISKGDGTGLTLNDKGEVILAPGSLPASHSWTVIAAALLALADSSDSDKDLYRPVIHSPPGPRTNHFQKAPTKTEIAAEWKAAKEAKQKEAKDKKAAAATRKADGLAKKQEKTISSAKAKASTAAAKAESLRSKLADVMKAAAVPEAAHLHKKSKGMLGNAPTNPPPTHTLSLSPQWKLMSAKKRVSVQSPLRPSYNKEDELLLDKLVMLVLSRSSGTSSTTTGEKDYGTLLKPTAL